MEKQIDILLPTYNGEKYVCEQIESILNQTYKNIKLIISDDCSKDETIKILRQYEQKDSRVKIYEQKENLGVIKNIEFLLEKVENELYMLSDQDDIWLPEKVEKSLQKIEKENADMVFGDLEVVDENLKTIYPSFRDFMKIKNKINKCINTNRINYLYNCVTGCTILSKKEFIKDILPLPTESKRVLHDHWIGLILSFKGKLAYMQETYIKYRQHGNNEVGTKKVSHSMDNLDEVRDLFIDVKLGVFRTYVENNDKFPQELQKLNISALKYYEMLEKKKKVNFRHWDIFYKLYKDESFMYFIENFIIMNMPALGKILFKVRYSILKALGKR